MRVPFRLATLFVAGICLAATAQPHDSGTIEFRLDPGAFDGTVTGDLILRSVTGSEVSDEFPIGDRTVRISKKEGSQWAVAIESEKWWSLPQTVTFPAAGAIEPRSLKMFRLGVVRGELTAGEKGVVVPSFITLSVVSAPDPVRPPAIPPRTEFRCAVGSDGKWACAVPAVTLDLALRVPGMTPHYRWAVAVTTQRPARLGTFALRKGASLTAWLDKDVASRLEPPARARLLRPVARSAAATAMRLESPVHEAAFDRKGMVQLAPIPPGVYTLEVLAPGFAPARVGPVEIFQGAETELRKPVELAPPLTVTVAVDPPRDPAGARWQIRFEQHGGHASAVPVAVSAFTDEAGVLAIPDQAPGTYFVQVRDHSGNKVWADVRAVRDETEATVRVKLDLQSVKGTVRLGSEPLAATLWFGGRDGAERVEMLSDESGAFEGTLGRLGPWQVQIESENPPAQTMVQVSVRKDEELDIELPDTYVAGWAVGSDGERLANGNVLITTASRAYPARLRSDGTFVFRGLPAGSVRLVAHDRRTGERSRSVAVDLIPGRRTESLELQTEPNRDVRGRVISQGAPVAGAKVMAFASDLGPQTGASSSTDLEGAFTVRLPAAAQRVLLIVHAPGRTLQSFHMPLQEEPLSLDVPRTGGTLDIVAPPAVRITQNGTDLPLSSLLDWIAAHGRDPLEQAPRFVVPDLAPGHYEACLDTPPGRNCRSGSLAAGGTLKLELPQ